MGNKTSIGQPIEPPNEKHSGWSNRPSEVDSKQCVLERSKPRENLERKRNVEKLEDDPEVTRVFDKKLIKRWGSKPVDLVAEFTYMEVVDTDTPLVDTLMVSTRQALTKGYSTTFPKKLMMNGASRRHHLTLCWALKEHQYTTKRCTVSH